MKKIGLLFVAIITIVTTSCTEKDAFTLTGKVVDTEMEGKEVYLQKMSDDKKGFDAIDTAIVKNGAFVFKGKADANPIARFISVADAPHLRPALFILEAGNIYITIDKTPSVKGTPMNDEYQAFSVKSDSINKKMSALGEEFYKAQGDGSLTPETEKRLMDESQLHSDELSKTMFDYTKKNMTNPVGEFFFMAVGNNFDEEQLKELLGMAGSEFKKDEKIQKLEEHLNKKSATDVGTKFIDVKGLTPQDKEIALSEYVGQGKVVLIDFWASWCGPCIQEMPIVVKAYSQYKSKGFEIVGISLDENKEAWTKSIAALKMTWPQMSDLKGWKSDLAAPYGVNSIPYTILLDKDGTIIAKNLRGKDLIGKLDELLN